MQPERSETRRAPEPSCSPLIQKLLRRKDTREFLTPQKTWTRDPRQALRIPSVQEAHEIKRQLQVQDLELYFLFSDEPDARYDFVVSLQ